MYDLEIHGLYGENENHGTLVFATTASSSGDRNGHGERRFL